MCEKCNNDMNDRQLIFCGDIHGANCGFKKDGTPVIFDYSDFWS